MCAAQFTNWASFDWGHRIFDNKGLNTTKTALGRLLLLRETNPLPGTVSVQEIRSIHSAKNGGNQKRVSN